MSPVADQHLTSIRDTLDSQHRRLLGIMDDMSRLIDEDCGEAALQILFGRFLRYARFHIRAEMRLLGQAGIPLEHSREHLAELADYLQRMSDLWDRHAAGERLIPEHTVASVRAWWSRHIYRGGRLVETMAGGRPADGEWISERTK